MGGGGDTGHTELFCGAAVLRFQSEESAKTPLNPAVYWKRNRSVASLVNVRKGSDSRLMVGDSRLSKMWNSPLYFPFHCRQFCYENSSKAKVPETS